MDRHCDGDAGTNLQPVPSYPSLVSRRFYRIANHASYAESECNGGSSVNQFLMYRENADLTCSYATPMDSNGLSMPDMEGHLKVHHFSIRTVLFHTVLFFQTVRLA